MLLKILGGILMYSIIIYAVIEFGPLYDFYPFSITPSNILHSTPFFLLVGALFWVSYDIIRRILKLVSFPLRMISFGLINIGVTIGIIYIFASLVNNLPYTISVSVGSIIEVLIFSLLLSIVGFILKYI